MNTIISIIGILITLFAVWFSFEIWRAPLMKENEDGSWTEIKPIKKLFKKAK
jgi:hypothetical protein